MLWSVQGLQPRRRLNQNFVANPVLKGIIYGLLSRICGLIPVQEVMPACDKGRPASSQGLFGASKEGLFLSVDPVVLLGGWSASRKVSQPPTGRQSSQLPINPVSTSLRFPFACLTNKRRKVAITPVATVGSPRGRIGESPYSGYVLCSIFARFIILFAGLIPVFLDTATEFVRLRFAVGSNLLRARSGFLSAQLFCG